MGNIEEDDVDYGRAAILLHDLFKQGLPPRDEEHTQKDHDRTASEYLGRMTDLPDEVLGLVDSHNGAWNEGKEPETELELLHHRADYIVSRKKCYYEIPDPCEELEQVIHERKTEKERKILDRADSLKEASEAYNSVSDYVRDFTLPGQGAVDPADLSRVIGFIVDGGDRS
jgi:hypothetical protein